MANDYNSGKVSNANLDPYKKQVKGKFVVYDINPYLLGGVLIRITFLDMSDRVFKEFCEIEEIDFERYSADIEWLNPIHSQNYVRMEAAESWQ